MSIPIDGRGKKIRKAISLKKGTVSFLPRIGGKNFRARLAQGDRT
jgi:hypothetical protein